MSFVRYFDESIAITREHMHSLAPPSRLAHRPTQQQNGILLSIYYLLPAFSGRAHEKKSAMIAGDYDMRFIYRCARSARVYRRVAGASVIVMTILYLKIAALLYAFGTCRRQPSATGAYR